VQCNTDAQCAAATPICSATNTCRGCVPDSTECNVKDPAMPICKSNNQCGLCTSDAECIAIGMTNCKMNGSCM
jgi:hypothetical protein